MIFRRVRRRGVVCMGPTVTQRTRDPARGILCARQSGRDWRGVSARKIPVPDAEPCAARGARSRGGGATTSFGRLRRLWRAARRGGFGAPGGDCEGLRGPGTRATLCGGVGYVYGLCNVRKLWGYARTQSLERLLRTAAERVTPPSRKGPAAAGGAKCGTKVKKFWNQPALRQSSPTGKLQTHCALSRKNALTCKCLKTCWVKELLGDLYLSIHNNIIWGK